MTVLELNKKMQSFNVNANVRKAIFTNQEKVVDLNRQQMIRGIAPDSNPIRPKYKSRVYADVKKERGGLAPFGTPDLKLTGAFQNKMYLIMSRLSEFAIWSKDDKTDNLSRKYDPFGLTMKSQEKAKVFNTETLSQLYRKHTGL